MALSKFVFRPGVVREGTAYDNEGGWFDINFRWDKIFRTWVSLKILC